MDENRFLLSEKASLKLNIFMEFSFSVRVSPFNFSYHHDLYKKFDSSAIQFNMYKLFASILHALFISIKLFYNTLPETNDEVQKFNVCTVRTFVE